jgi:hypothetical protein
VEGYACSFDCLEAFAVKYIPFKDAVQAFFWRFLEFR